MTKITPSKMGRIISSHFPEFKYYSPTGGLTAEASLYGKNFTNTGYSTQKSNFFQDFCQIGALLSDEVRCVQHLATLNFEMYRLVKQQLSAFFLKWRHCFDDNYPITRGEKGTDDP